MSQNGETHFKNLAANGTQKSATFESSPILTLINNTSILLPPCHQPKIDNPANIFLFTVNNRDTRKKCKICSKFSIKTQERRQ